MTTLPHDVREVHEVLEHEYVSMYGPLERVDVRYGPEQIVDVAWVLTILRVCGLADDPLTVQAAQTKVVEARILLAKILNAVIETDGDDSAERNRVRAEQRLVLRERLVRSPSLTTFGRALIDGYDELFTAAPDEMALQELHRRILDDAFGGAVRPLRDLRLANLYRHIHGRARNDESMARTALCISRGRIRSPTFALGVLQGLATAKILDKFDFLSTVSGGGYVGSWLSSWARRHPHGMSGVQEDLARSDTAAGGTISAAAAVPETPREKDRKLDPEPKPVRHLREYSNYLRPRLRLLSADGWTTVALYIRNLFLNLLVMVPVMTALLGLPRAYAYCLGTTFFVADWVFPTFTVVFLFLAFRYIGVHRPVTHERAGVATRGGNADWSLFVRFIVPLVGAAVAMTLYWADLNSGPRTLDETWAVGGPAILAALAMTVWPYAVYYRRVARSLDQYSLADAASVKAHVRRKKMIESMALIFGLGVAAVLVWVLFAKVFHEPLQDIDDLIRLAERSPSERAGHSLVPWSSLYLCFAVPGILLVFYIQTLIFVGISSHRNDDGEREWWARGGAWLLVAAVAWLLVSGLGVFGPVALYHTPEFIKFAGGVAGVVAAVRGFSGKTPALKKEQGRGVTGKAANAALGLATPMFALFFLALISLCTLAITFATHEVKPGVGPSGKWSSRKFALDATLTAKATRSRPSREHPNVEIVEESAAKPRLSMSMLQSLVHLRTIARTEVWELIVLIVLAALALVVSRTIGGNKFSMHALYRNRLIRACLGASRYSRDPHPLTGFDEKDDLQMYQLRPELLSAANLTNPHALLDALREGARAADTVLQGKALGRRQLAQHLWSRFYDSTRKHLMARRVTIDAISAVIENLNEILLDERDLLENVADLGLPAAFWALSGVGDRIPYPPVVRNRAVLDHFFRDVITAMPRPNDAIHDETDIAWGYENGPDTGAGLARRGPLHVVNLAVNLVSGQNLAWQQRRTSSFTISPYDAGSVTLGYRDARLYGGAKGVSLGTAVTISGVGASPNTGYHSSPAMGFLLTLFNVRLGWWLGNPGPVGQGVFHMENPTTSVGPMLQEMVGRNNDAYEWVYLSDGGHFDNLGLYEMVLRRCHCIVLSDAGADPDFTFEDLGNAIRKIRVDLGVPIDIEEMFMAPRRDDDFPDGRYVGTATIRYSAVDGADAKNGVLIYLKPGIYKDDYLPHDVLNYAKESPSFPHEIGEDQDFSDTQFESYRALGRHVINDICRNYPDRHSTARPRIPIAKEFESVAQFANFVEDAARVSGAAAPEQVIATAIRESLGVRRP